MSDDRTNILGLDRDAPEALGEALGHALGLLAGYASLCWDPKPTGVFQPDELAPAVDEVANWLLERAAAASVLSLFDGDQLDVFDEIRQMMLDNEQATGQYTVQSEVRQKGCSVHYKWPNTVDVLTTSSQFVAITDQAPAKLFWVLDKILTAAGRPLPED